MRRLSLAALLVLGAAACRKPSPAPPLPKASKVVAERWRLLKEVGPVQSGLADLEAKVFGATSAERKLWSGYLVRAQGLRAQAETLARHHATDVKWLVVIRTGSDPGLLAAFIRSANDYVAATRRSAVQLEAIVARLQRMTVAPRSWTEREFREASAAYQGSRQEMRRAGAAMAGLLERI